MGKRKLKQAFYHYIFVMFAVVLCLSGIAVKICTSMRDRIIASHAYIYEPGSDMAGGYGNLFIYGYAIPPEKTFEQNEADTGLGKNQEDDLQAFTEKDKFLCHALEIMTVLLPFLFLCAGIWLAGSVFYSKKLKKPFYLLNQGITHIEQGNLDFSLQYAKQDELGNLCGAFETMRQRVLENNTEMWNMVEERKKLNASVAHDLRTPITLIKGYSEYLMRNMKNEAVSENNKEEVVSYIQNAANRLEAYANSVHHIHMLENMDLEYDEADVSMLSDEITAALRVIEEEYGKTICVSADLPERTVRISTVTVFRIIENVVQNACHYSKEKVCVELALEGEYFTMMVTDDGRGFSEKSISKAFFLYYREEGKDNHYGMGLAVCKILSEKHGGDIFLSNAESKGAKVFVKLKIKNCN